MATSSKRPEQLAWVSLILGMIFFGVAFFLGRWSGYFAVTAVAWQGLAAAMIWLVLAIQFHQRALAEQEKLDMSQLSKDERASTIFQARGEQAGLFAAAQGRLAVLEKWFIPAFSVVIAAYEIGIAIYLMRQLGPSAEIETQQPLICAVAMTAVAFVSFLMSRYATGMSAEPQWKPLRAGGSFFLGLALVCFALAVGLALVHFQVFRVVRVVAYVVCILLAVLGVETFLNVILDVYRPRLKGRYSRAAFDSRLLGVLNEPGGIFRSAASAIDYQFGFQVSQTWFYKLLEKAIVPLILFSVVTLHLASCIVVVAPDEQAIIERFGNPLTKAGQRRLLGPGLSLKWPWPIDIAYRYPTEQVMDLSVGFVPRIDPDTKQRIRGPLLWGEEHHEAEYNVLIATERAEGSAGQRAAPVGLMRASLPIQYRVRDLYSYLYNHRRPEEVLEAICYHELAKFAAGGVESSLLGAGQANAKRTLTERIQTAADAEGLGVEIVLLGLQGLHPPPDLVPAYQAVVGAIQKKQATILQAQASRNATLSNLIGSVDKADALYELAGRYQKAQEDPGVLDVNDLAAQLDTALEQASGEVFAALRNAQGYAFEKATLARGTGERFAGQIKAFRAAPEIYQREQRLTVLEEALQGVRKYVIAVDPNHAETFIIDLQEKLQTTLYDMTGVPENSGQ